MKLLKYLVVLMLFVNAPVVWAQATSTPQSIDEIIVKSGMQRQVGELPDVIKASVNQRLDQDTKLTDDQKSKLKDVFTKSFDATVILKDFKDYVASQLTQQDADSVLTWLNSPLGQKITHLEENASSAESYKKMQEFAQGLQTTPPDPKRVAVLQQLDQAAHLTENDVKLRMEMASSMARSMAPALGQKGFSESAMTAQLEEHRPQIENAAKQGVIIGGLFTYQTLTEDELQKYIDFNNSDAGKKYSTIMGDGVLASLKNAFSQVGRNLGELLKQETVKAPDTKSTP